MLGHFFVRITVNQQHNDADITVIYCSLFTVNSHFIKLP